MPSIKIGNGTRIGPYPGDNDARSSRLQTPPNNFTPSNHSHGQSSSIDLSYSPDFYTASQSTPHSNSSLRQRLRHKASFSLPAIQKTDFSDMRRSFDDLRRPDEGIDLPCIPVGPNRDGRHLTPVTEKDESNESSLMRKTLDEMGPALTALDKLQNSTTSTSSRMDFTDLAPAVLHGHTIGMTSLASFATDEEEMAEEMERVMAMDTPTRSDFVISASQSTTTASGSQSSKQVPPDPRVEEKYSTSPESTTMTMESSSNVSSMSPVRAFRHSTYAVPITSHPHPPPLHPDATQTTVTAKFVPVAASHPPVHGLANKKSTETVRSDMTTTSSAITASPTRAPEFKPSRQELMLVKQLRSRRSQSAMALHQTKGSEESVGAGQRKGLRPLQLVDRNIPCMSAPLPVISEKRIGLEAASGPKLSNQTRTKMSAPIARLARGSETSRGSGVSGLRV